MVCEPRFIQVHILDNESDISIKLKYFCKFSFSMNEDLFPILQKLVYGVWFLIYIALVQLVNIFKAC